MSRIIVAPNPMSSDVDWILVETTLGVKIVPNALQREVVPPTRVSEGVGNLLGAEPDEVEGGGEFPNLFRLRGLLERGGLCGADGDVLSSFVEGFAARQHVIAPDSSVASTSPLTATASVPMAVGATPEAIGAAGHPLACRADRPLT